MGNFATEPKYEFSMFIVGVWKINFGSEKAHLSTL